MVKRGSILLVCFLGLCFVSHAWALSTADVQNFIQAAAKLTPYFDKYEEMEGEAEDTIADGSIQQMKTAQELKEEYVKEQEELQTGFSPDRVVGELLEVVNKNKDMQDIIKDSGFSSVKQWAQVGGQVIQAMLAIEMGEQKPQVAQQMQAMMSQVESSSQMSQEMKDNFKAKMKDSLSQMQNMYKAPEADIKAVTPYMTELKKVLEWDDKE